MLSTMIEVWVKKQNIQLNVTALNVQRVTNCLRFPDMFGNTQLVLTMIMNCIPVKSKNNVRKIYPIRLLRNDYDYALETIVQQNTDIRRLLALLIKENIPIPEELIDRYIRKMPKSESPDEDLPFD